jgi:hypothetical protein
MQLKLGSVKLTNFTSKQEQKILDCLELVIDAVNSPEFRDCVMNYKHKIDVVVGTTGSLWWRKYQYDTHIKDGFYFAPGERIMSNEQVYREVMEGSEEETPEKDSEMDLVLTGRSKRFTSATAYGYPGDDEIVLYHWWVDQASVPELCNTIFHEWLHNCRFEHEFNWNKCRDYSAPYGLGEIVEHIVKKFIAPKASQV